MKIGSYIYYKPSGEYNWQAKYWKPYESDSNKKLASGSRYDILSEDGTIEEELINSTICIWRVFSKDDTTGTVEVVPVSGEVVPENVSALVILEGEQGYNNAVKLLNDACSDLYKDTSKGITARSLNIEDIEKTMTEAGLKKAHNYPYETAEEVAEAEMSDYCNPTFGKRWTTSSEGYRDSTGAFIFAKSYPIIYEQEAGREIDGIHTTSGLGKSEQTSFIEINEDTIRGCVTNATSIRPKQTAYMLSSYDEGSFKTEFIDILPDGFVASRCVNLNFDGGDYSCSFGVFSVRSDFWNATSSLELVDLYSSTDYSSGEHQDYLIPVVSLSSNIIGLSENDEIYIIENYEP